MKEVDITNDRIYPRGFVGKRLVDVLNESGDEYRATTVMMQAVAGTTVETVNSRMLPHPEVEELFFSILKDPLLLREFNVRERILRTARSMFTNDLKRWVYSQHVSPAFSNNHFEFIKQMFEYAETGRSRLSNHTWSSLLKGNITPLSSENKPSAKEVDDYTHSEAFPSSIVSFLVNVTKQPQGWSQLVFFLHILFGDVENVNDGITAKHGQWW